MGTFGPLGSSTASGPTAGPTCGPATGAGALPAAGPNTGFTPGGTAFTSLSFSSNQSSLSDNPTQQEQERKLRQCPHFTSSPLSIVAITVL